MGTFQNPIGDKPKDPYESYRVEEIQKDKIAKEDATEQSRKPRLKKKDLGPRSSSYCAE